MLYISMNHFTELCQFNSKATLLRRELIILFVIFLKQNVLAAINLSVRWTEIYLVFFQLNNHLMEERFYLPLRNSRPYKICWSLSRVELPVPDSRRHGEARIARLRLDLA